MEYFGEGEAIIAWPIFAASSVNPLLCSIKDLLTASASCRFFIAKESDGGTFRLVLMLDIALCTCATVLLLPTPEITEEDVAEVGVTGDGVAGYGVAEDDEKWPSDTSVELSSVPENVTENTSDYVTKTRQWVL